ncbi:MAG: hypothetical protein JOY54_16735 [Acidobacteriaceae bacterium]|nr:hypothetical protein [Acidobacteriaceae bacterium]
MRVVILLLLVAAALCGDTFKLYLKDGGYHLVREYQVQGDRVKFYSTERGDWEEMPLDLVDLSKTEEARKVRADETSREARAEDEEEKAERELRHEIEAIPVERGAYYNDGQKVKGLAVADYQVVTDKRRKAIQVLSPVPLVPGKASVVIKGEHSNFVVTEDRPSFYLRLAKEERFGIIRLEPKKQTRIVENISIIPVAKQAEEQRKQMDTFDQQLAEGLYRVWPEKPLTPGEYALVEFSDTGDKDDIELLIWDFSYRPTAK